MVRRKHKLFGWKPVVAGVMALSLTSMAGTRSDYSVSSAPFMVPDSIPDDTLLPVIITPDGNLPVPIKKPEIIRTPSVSDILGQDLTDKIMHPFAFSRRKRERHRRKMMKILEEYDKIKTPRELIIEAMRKEGIDVDSLLMLNNKDRK